MTLSSRDKTPHPSGFGLRLLPVRMISPGNGYSHVILDISSAYDLLSPIHDLRPEAIPLTVSITSHVGGVVLGGKQKGSLTYGMLRSDAYGEPYTWIRASRLLPVLSRRLPRRSPVTAYVRAMPGDDLIVLDWH